MIEIRGVTKEYGNGVLGLNDVNLTIRDGEFVAIIGPSGAGKSTLLRSINRLNDITGGDIMIDGQSITKASRRQLRAMRCSIGMIFQQFNLVGNSTVQKNVLSGRLGRYGTLKSLLGLFPESDYQLIDDALKTVVLADKAQTRSDQLSGGQQQRVAIARALSLNPDAIIADEPTSALDVSVRAQILNLLSDLKKSLGLSLVFISHDIQTARYVSDEIVVMNHGTIVERGAAYDVLNNPQDSYTKLLLGAAPSLLHPTAEECR